MNVSLNLCDGMKDTKHNILMRAGNSLGDVALDVPLAEMLAELHQDAGDDFLKVITNLATGHDWYEVIPDQADFYGMLRGPIRGVYVPEEIAAGDPYIAGIDAIAMGYALRYGPESWKAYIREWLGSLTAAQWGEMRAIWHHELKCWVHELETLAHEDYPEYAGKEVQVRVVEHAKFRHDCAKALMTEEPPVREAEWLGLVNTLVGYYEIFHNDPDPRCSTEVERKPLFEFYRKTVWKGLHWRDYE